jgi:hypothetical protein
MRSKIIQFHEISNNADYKERTSELGTSNFVFAMMEGSLIFLKQRREQNSWLQEEQFCLGMQETRHMRRKMKGEIFLYKYKSTCHGE